MNVLIVGLGSMGKRRARLTARLRKDAKLFGVDKAESRRAEAKALGVEAFASLDEALAAAKPDAALVCTAPLSHAAIIDRLLDADVPVFTELNLVADGYAAQMCIRDSGRSCARRQPIQKNLSIAKNTHEGVETGWKSILSLSLIHIWQPRGRGERVKRPARQQERRVLPARGHGVVPVS